MIGFKINEEKPHIQDHFNKISRHYESVCHNMDVIQQALTQTQLIETMLTTLTAEQWVRSQLNDENDLIFISELISVFGRAHPCSTYGCL